MVVHDFAYAEICFDGYKAPSILEVPGARDVAIEFGSLSKSHSMAGWRVGFAAGNPEMIHALGRIKSYLDYGMPHADPDRRDRRAARAAGLRHRERRGRTGAPRRADRRARRAGRGRSGRSRSRSRTMFVWAPIPEPLRALGSLEFAQAPADARRRSRSRRASASARSGEGFVRFALVENRHRIRQAVRGIRRFLRGGGRR